MFELKLSLNELNAVLAALGRMPYEQVAGLINNVQQQAQPQVEKVQSEQQKMAEFEAARQENAVQQ